MIENDSNKEQSVINEIEIISKVEKMFRRYELSYIQFDINFFNSEEYKSIFYTFGDKGIGFYFRLYKELFFSNNVIIKNDNQLIKFKIIKKNEVGMLNNIIELDLFSVNAANILYSKKLFENLYIMKKQVATREINKLNNNKNNIEYSLNSCEEILNQYSQEGNFNVIVKTEKRTGIIEENKDIAKDINKTSNIVINGKQSLDKFLADKFSNDEEKKENYLKNIN